MLSRKEAIRKHRAMWNWIGSMLSRKEAIRKHRAMWNWIGSMLKSGLWKSVIDTSMSDSGLILEDPNALSVGDVVILLKYAYIHMIGDGHVGSSCYLCDYTVRTFGSCQDGTLCPIIWPNIAKSSLCSHSLYYLIRHEATSFKEAGDIAFEIANLPERRVIHEARIIKEQNICGSSDTIWNDDDLLIRRRRNFPFVDSPDGSCRFCFQRILDCR